MRGSRQSGRRLLWLAHTAPILGVGVEEHRSMRIGGFRVPELRLPATSRLPVSGAFQEPGALLLKDKELLPVRSGRRLWLAARPVSHVLRREH
jgi:hypothetical protein